jgi:hypothetical protein
VSKYWYIGLVIVILAVLLHWRYGTTLFTTYSYPPFNDDTWKEICLKKALDSVITENMTFVKTKIGESPVVIYNNLKLNYQKNTDGILFIINANTNGYSNCAVVDSVADRLQFKKIFIHVLLTEKYKGPDKDPGVWYPSIVNKKITFTLVGKKYRYLISKIECSK